MHNRSLFSTWIVSKSKRLITHIFVLLFAPNRFRRLIEHAIHDAKVYHLATSLKSCGNKLGIQFPVTITEPDMVALGNNVSLAAYVHIWGGGQVTIGNRVMIGTHTSIVSLTHDYREEIMYFTLVSKPVSIEDDVWIGSNCVILPGIRIGSGAVIGAGSVVTKDVDPKSVVAGAPARPITSR